MAGVVRTTGGFDVLLRGTNPQWPRFRFINVNVFVQHVFNDTALATTASKFNVNALVRVVHQNVAKCNVADMVATNGTNGQANAGRLHVFNQDVRRGFPFGLDGKRIVLVPDGTIVNVNVGPRDIKTIRVEGGQVNCPVRIVLGSSGTDVRVPYRSIVQSLGYKMKSGTVQQQHVFKHKPRRVPDDDQRGSVLATHQITHPRYPPPRGPLAVQGSSPHRRDGQTHGIFQHNAGLRHVTRGFCPRPMFNVRRKFQRAIDLKRDRGQIVGVDAAHDRVRVVGHHQRISGLKRGQRGVEEGRVRKSDRRRLFGTDGARIDNLGGVGWGVPCTEDEQNGQQH